MISGNKEKLFIKRRNHKILKNSGAIVVKLTFDQCLWNLSWM